MPSKPKSIEESHELEVVESIFNGNTTIKFGDSSYIVNGDCISVLKEIPSSSIDCIITDPPYNLGLFMHNRNTNMGKMRENHFAYKGWDDMEYNEWLSNMRGFLTECARILKPRGTFISFMAIIKVESFIQLATECGLYYKTTGIWHKKNPMPRNMKLQFVNSTECWIYMVNKGTSGTFHNNGKVVHDFLESGLCPSSEKKHGKHPTQKPLSILNTLISTVTNPGDIVLDPFMGSGSTCVSSAINDRHFIGIELSEEYFRIAEERLKDTIS